MTPDLQVFVRQLEAVLRLLTPQDLTPAGAGVLRRLIRENQGDRNAADGSATRTVDELSSTDAGLWLVHTSSGAHLIDLDNRTFVDINRPGTAPRAFDRFLRCAVAGDLVVSSDTKALSTIVLAGVWAIEPWPRRKR